jgi:hypothetical protein
MRAVIVRWRLVTTMSGTTRSGLGKPNQPLDQTADRIQR